MVAGSTTFFALDLLPVGAHRLRIGRRLRGEHMRVAAYELVAKRGDHVGECKRPLLGRHLRMEDHLQQQVAQLVAQASQVVAIDRIGHLVGFFDGVWRDAGEGLLHIPGTAVFAIAQTRHHVQQLLDIADGWGLRHRVFLEPVSGCAAGAFPRDVSDVRGRCTRNRRGTQARAEITECTFQSVRTLRSHAVVRTARMSLRPANRARADWGRPVR